MKWIAAIAILFSVSAQASIGSITDLNGAATIKRGSAIFTAAKGAAIEQNDRVETKNGKVKITFNDDTTVSVAEHSSLIIDDFVYDPKSGAGKLGLKAAGGTVRYVSGAIAHKNPNAVNITTPTAAIAVRGTDFVMSVNEIGSSMVILMPSCENGGLGEVCTSGAIDVESGPNTVSMNRPYQATLVESTGQPPTPPITVNLFATPVGNNLQISPPKTESGQNVVAAARAAAQASGVTKNSNTKDPSPEQQAVATAAPVTPTAEVQTNTKVQTTAQQEIVVTATKSNKDPYLLIKWGDSAQTQQIGWIYESISPSGLHYENVDLPTDTNITIWVSQDGEGHGYAFSPSPQGRINIIQRSN